MNLDAVLCVLRDVAPEHLAEDWDQVGLHLAGGGGGSGGRKAIRKALLCIDLTPAVLDEAIQKKCPLIVAYHPPIFHPLKRLADRDWKEQMLAKAVRKGIAVYSPHTALDAARQGMNDWLCNGLGKHRGRCAIGVPSRPRAGQHKIVVYVPRDHTDALREAMAGAGAGGIGRYRECSFNIDGIGTFRGQEGTDPFIGRPGRLEAVEETRVEMICGASRLGAVLKAIRAAHPYEEPAVDVLDLVPEPESFGQAQAPGRIHHLSKPISARVLVGRVKRTLGLQKLKAAIPDPYEAAQGNQIESIAVCVGAGGKLFESSPAADAYITGEMQHHQVLDLYLRGKVVILAGHTNTERPFLENYREALLAAGGAKVDWQISETDRAPMQIV